MACLRGLLLSASSALACLSTADIITDWEKRFHVVGRSESFHSTAIDSNGNVYAAGTSFNGVNDDAIVVKYGPAGGLHWAVYVTGPGNQSANKIAVTPDGSNLFVAYDASTTTAKFASLNPANGAVLWDRSESVSATREIHSSSVLIDKAVTPRVHWGCGYFQAGVISAVTNHTYSFAGVQSGAFGSGATNVNHRFADSALRPGGGCYYLMADPALIAQSDIVRVSALGDYVNNFGTGTPTALAASTSALYSVGPSAAGKVRITRYDLATNGITGNVEDTFTGATQVRVNSASATPTNIAFGGSESVPGLGTEWLMAAYNPNLIRLWRTVRPNTTNNEFFRQVLHDPFSNIAGLGVRAGATDQIYTNVYDAVSGLKLGQSSTSAPSGATNLFGVSVNPNGIFATGGTIQDGADVKGLLWKTSQNGLRSLTSSQASYTGGAVAALSAQMYAITGANRKVTLTSNSTFAPVPEHVVILASKYYQGFTSTTLPTTVPRTITITGTWQGVARAVTFYLLP